MMEEAKYLIRSKFCGILVDDILRTEWEATKKVAELNNEAIAKGFPEVEYEMFNHVQD